jgi:hypothetical protein
MKKKIILVLIAIFAIVQTKAQIQRGMYVDNFVSVDQSTGLIVPAFTILGDAKRK